MKEIIYKPIGIIHSPFKDLEGIPIQPTASYGIAGTVEVKPQYTDGLKDIEGFSHIILLYHFHLSNGPLLQVKPFLDDKPRVYIEDVDIVDGTPLLDIKPYVPQFDHRHVDKIGWLSENANNVYKTKADNRFK